ncbi:MAG TPA: cysteine desulfurase family protein [Acidimicrobiales bacterium]
MPEQLAYLDHAATTPLRPEARAAMLPWLGERFGNPSGAHRVARAARQAIDEARDAVAEAVGCQPGEVVFTSGGTEADNLAVRGVHAARPGRVLCSAVEHDAVLGPVAAVGGDTVPVDGRGAVDLDALARALAPDTTLVSVMAANNEVGTVQPLAQAAEVVRRLTPRAALHADAVQAAPWLALPPLVAGADLVSLSSHKLGGPQGVGALVVRRGTPLRAQALGGGQERELRSGTHNVAGIVGFAAALRATLPTRDETAGRVRHLRDRLARGLVAAVPGTVVTGTTATSGTADRADAGHAPGRLPGCLHLCLPGVESEALLFLLDEAGVCASAASACASGAQQASHVLAAMGIPAERSRGALRLSLGWTSTDADIDHALATIPAAVARLQAVAA